MSSAGVLQEAECNLRPLTREDLQLRALKDGPRVEETAASSESRLPIEPYIWGQFSSEAVNGSYLG